MKTKLLIFLVTFLGLLTLNACSTMEGAGKDIQKVGNAIEKKAKKI